MKQLTTSLYYLQFIVLLLTELKSKHKTTAVFNVMFTLLSNTPLPKQHIK